MGSILAALFILMEAVSAKSTIEFMSAFGKMNALATSAYGTNFPIPAPGELHSRYSGLPANASCEVLIAVAYSSVNPSDYSPTMALTDHYPKPMGSDVCGRIIATHGTCSRLAVGDTVWGDIGANTHTSSGAKTKELGGYAQFAVALEAQLSKIPANMPTDEAGSLPKVALTSYKALVWYGALESRPVSDRKVLILGGSGGTGSVAVQLAKYAFHSPLVSTTTSADNFEYVRSLGADVLIDYHTTEWWNASVIADGSQDVVYDCVGQRGTGDRAVRKVKPGGHYVTITGALAREPLPPGVTQHSFINSDTNLGSAELLEILASFAADNAVRMPRRTSFNLTDVSAAFSVSQSGHVNGKLVIRVPPATEAARRLVMEMWTR